MTNHAQGYDPASSGRDPLVPSGSDGVPVDPPTPVRPPGEISPMTINERRQWHMNELAALCPDRPQDHGWSPFSRRLFLDTLAETGKVGEACEVTRLARSGAYALRNRDRVFAAGWDAAAALARATLADRLAEQAIDGITDTVNRADGSTVTRHRFDSRLSIAVLNRLDRRCDRAEATGGGTFAIQAQWEDYLAAIGTGDHAAAQAMIAPAPPPATAADPVPGELAKNAPVRPHCPNTDEPDITKLSTAELLRRMKAMRDGTFGDELATDDPLSGDGGGDDDAPLALWERVWTDDKGDCITDFAPPEGFTGWEDGGWGEPDYQRALSPEEQRAYVAVQAEWAAEDEAEIAGKRDYDALLRDRFFGLRAEPDATGGGDPVSDGGEAAR